MDEASQAQKGMCIENRYRIVRKIAQGGMATVYQAQDERLGRPVAIKIMHTQLAQGIHRQQFIARFRREATSAASIANPHIVQVYDTGEYEGLDYLVMEYVHGVNLRYEMNMQGTFSVKDTLRLLAETLDGLASAHQAGVVHRDIKPENILINDRGHVQITDFGLARATSQATLSSTGLLLGTAAYLAPELIEHNLATPQGDLYSAGMMAWEMLAGRVPFTADNPVTLVFKHVHENTPSIRTVCTEINEDVAQYLSKLTARDMNERPDNAGEALAQLREISKKLSQKDWQYKIEPTQDDQESQESQESEIFSPLDHLHTSPVEHYADDSKSTNDFDYISEEKSSDKPSEQSNDNIDDHEVLDEKTIAINRSDIDSSQKSYSSTSQNSETDDSQDDSQDDPLSEFDDSNMPTIAINARNISSANNAIPVLQPEGPTNESDKNKNKSRKKAFIIAGCSTVGILALVAIGSFWYLLGPGSYWTLPKPDDLKCLNKAACKITDVDWHQYERTLKVAGIPYTVSKDYSDDIAAGKILSTNPDVVGGHIAKHSNSFNSRLRVVLSMGVRKSTIPSDITDSNAHNGKNPIKALKKAGFTNIIHRKALDVYSLDVPAGSVIDITPKPGTRMNHNDEVSILLSKGPMPVQMPDIVNHIKTDADQALNDAKLNVTYEEENSDTVEKGKIISASVAAGTQLHWGDSVKVVISKGPKTVSLPNVCGKNTDEARKIIEGLGLQVRVSAPLGDFMHVVRFQSPGAGTQVPLKDAHGNPSVITLTVI